MTDSEKIKQLIEQAKELIKMHATSSKPELMFGLQFLCNYFLLLLTKPFSEIKIITALYSTVI